MLELLGLEIAVGAFCWLYCPLPLDFRYEPKVLMLGFLSFFFPYLNPLEKSGYTAYTCMCNSHVSACEEDGREIQESRQFTVPFKCVILMYV